MKRGMLLCIAVLLGGCVFSAAPPTVPSPLPSTSPPTATGAPPTATALPAASPTATDVPPATAMPTATPLPPTATPAPTATLPPLSIPTLVPWQLGEVRYDFVAHACEAVWTTNATVVPCADGNIEEPGVFPGVYNLGEGNIPIMMPLILAVPGMAYPEGLGLFGLYPPFQVQAGDVFRAVLSCQDNSPCEATFALMYRDAQGQYHTLQSWPHRLSDGIRVVEVNLDSLAGQTVQFSLALQVNENASQKDNFLLWVRPVIEAPASPEPTADEGVVAGRVDFTTAPPFVNDPVLGSAPVVVVFHEMTQDTYTWVQTKFGDGSFRVHLPPGQYEVLAYGTRLDSGYQAVAAYTGMDPSCGQPLKPVTVVAGETVTPVVLNDWNTCASTAERPGAPPLIPEP